MCHLAASKTPFGALCASQPVQSLGTLLRIKQGALILPTWHAVTCQPSNTSNCPQESLLLYLRNTPSSCLGAA